MLLVVYWIIFLFWCDLLKSSTARQALLNNWFHLLDQELYIILYIFSLIKTGRKYHTNVLFCLIWWKILRVDVVMGNKFNNFDSKQGFSGAFRTLYHNILVDVFWVCYLMNEVNLIFIQVNKWVRNNLVLTLNQLINNLCNKIKIFRLKFHKI